MLKIVVSETVVQLRCCGVPVVEDLDSQVVTCENCRTVYDGSEVVELCERALKGVKMITRSFSGVTS